VTLGTDASGENWGGGWEIFAKNRLDRNKSRRKKGSIKANVNEPVRQALTKLARKWHFVVAEYVPGLTNRADKPSRTITVRNDWTIRGDVLEEVWHRMGLSHSINAFADDDNHHLPLDWTYFPSPHASGTNAMAQIWHRHQLGTLWQHRERPQFSR